MQGNYAIMGVQTDNLSDNDNEFPVCSMETIGNMSKRDNTDPIIVTPTVDGQQLPIRYRLRHYGSSKVYV